MECVSPYETAGFLFSCDASDKSKPNQSTHSSVFLRASPPGHKYLLFSMKFYGKIYSPKVEGGSGSNQSGMILCYETLHTDMSCLV